MEQKFIDNAFACAIAYMIMGVFLYFALNYKRQGIYTTVFGETMEILGIVIAVGLIINLILLRFSVHQSEEDKNRKK